MSNHSNAELREQLEEKTLLTDINLATCSECGEQLEIGQKIVTVSWTPPLSPGDTDKKFSRNFIYCSNHEDSALHKFEELDSDENSTRKEIVIFSATLDKNDDDTIGVNSVRFKDRSEPLN